MPKMKTNKAAARRFKITGTGKVLHKQAGRRHLNEWKSANVKRNLRGFAEVSPAMKEAVLEMFPYKKYLR
ncbi:MAG: 50S ribosomal protein L35 [Candidatus Obscuribacterales bacterium]|nr:50S ribosomal protein L35 [Candidatus Obscuribacterales bacterium]